MRILVLGSGAREHAIITALLAEQAGHVITAAPGNAGIAADVETVSLDPTNGELVAEYAIENGVELVVVGPEAPLIAGVADPLRTRGIPVFGPSRPPRSSRGRRPSPSASCPRPGSRPGARCTPEPWTKPSPRSTSSALRTWSRPTGSPRARGVLVTEDRQAAIDHATYWLQHGRVVVEEFLDGEEVSLFFLSDGHDVRALSPAQDHKRLGDGDTGPNTGGMVPTPRCPGSPTGGSPNRPSSPRSPNSSRSPPSVGSSTRARPSSACSTAGSS